MTDEEMADKYVIDTGNNDCTIEAFLAGLKAGRLIWHDLRKDPNDLPKVNQKVLLQIKDEIKPIETVGFLLEESADYLILAQSYSCSENSVRGGYIIYKKNILEKRTCK